MNQRMNDTAGLFITEFSLASGVLSCSFLLKICFEAQFSTGFKSLLAPRWVVAPKRENLFPSAGRGRRAMDA